MDSYKPYAARLAFMHFMHFRLYRMHTSSWQSCQGRSGAMSATVAFVYHLDLLFHWLLLFSKPSTFSGRNNTNSNG
jgi:hypothetical protein